MPTTSCASPFAMRSSAAVFLGVFHAADEQFDFVAGFFEDASRGKKMLHRKNFRGSHQRGLAIIFDGDHRGLQRDNGFSAAHIALQQAVHGHGLFQVGGNFREDTFLRGSRLEWKHFLQSVADAVFTQAEGDGIGFADKFAIERESSTGRRKILRR